MKASDQEFHMHAPRSVSICTEGVFTLKYGFHAHACMWAEGDTLLSVHNACTARVSYASGMHLSSNTCMHKKNPPSWRV